MRVPWGIIEQIVHPAGRRLPSAKGMFPVTNNDAKYRPFTSSGYVPAQTSLQLVLRNDRKAGSFQVGNLLNADYREFSGSGDTASDYAACRGCDTICRSKVARDMHRFTCKTTVLASIKLLGRDGLCAVCDKKTAIRMWGVPLCSNNCQSAWRYFTPPAFREARRLVIQLGKETVDA